MDTELVAKSVATTESAAANTEASKAIALANDYVIDSPEVLAYATEDLRKIVTREKQLDEKRLEITRPIAAGITAINEMFKPAITGMQEAGGIIRRKVLSFQREEEARIEREKAELAAKQEKERKRLQAIADEAAETARQAAEALAATAATGDADAIAAAESAAELAASEAEDATMEVEISEISAPVVQQVATKSAGISTRDNWTAEVSDLSALIEAAGKDPERYAPYLLANEKALGALAKSLKGQAKVPGVVFKNNPILAVGRKS